MSRSARRHTVRATCRRAASSEPDGITKVLSAGFFPSISSIQPSTSATCDSSMRTIFELLFAPSGVARSAPMSKSRDCACEKISTSRASNGFDARHAAMASPMNAFSSSTVPYASMRGWSLETRVPEKRPVVPSSPVRV